MASTTLTWRKTTAAKTGTAIANLIADIVSAVDAVAEDDDFKWQVASSNSGSTPYYVVLKRKNGDPGRILLVQWTSTPSGANSKILDQNPNSGTTFLAYFPNGNVDTPSALTSSSGTIMGDDTGCTKVIPFGSTQATNYASNMYPVVWDSEEAVHITLQSSVSTTAYWGAAGAIYVDGSDNPVDGVASSESTLNNFGTNSWSPYFVNGTPAAGGPTSTVANRCLRAIIAGADEVCYFVYSFLNSWHQLAASASPLADTGASKAWFVPMLIMRKQAGIGVTLRLRQFAFGPVTTAAFAEYNSSTMIPAAINVNGNSSGAASPWFCNFKV